MPRQARTFLFWAVLVTAITLPIAIAATSPLLAWRSPIYIVAGFAGVVALGLLLLQPLLVGGYIPELRLRKGRQLHAWFGAGLLLAVAVHVVGLWLTSPPDVIDALLFRSPTAFSAWGVVAMWAVAATALLALLRHRLRLRFKVWRVIHLILAVVIAAGSIVHAILIEGTMGTVSKVAICLLVLSAVAKVIIDVSPWAKLRPRKTKTSHGAY